MQTKRQTGTEYGNTKRQTNDKSQRQDLKFHTFKTKTYIPS